jgi:hypothetical protein
MLPILIAFFAGILATVAAEAGAAIAIWAAWRLLRWVFTHAERAL